jgi:hypothetical protein
MVVVMPDPSKQEPESDMMRQIRDALDDRRRRPIKELGIPDYREDAEGESDKRDAAWEHQRDEGAQQKGRRGNTEV